eukprot:gnl/MRDRNA2_/MRDRNA2_72242_c0_seq2.p1 gnl/MRDRNA2_/MRDRNA2_72242_c0~~gnl/MRDRNA2_/MRDRNA2_72242_c0_seq2.p1  ORF type:complete len:588 (+),score=102.93 gnl/MRDRNA2_/MRDRNA2_72242_c0_seq2:95-1858(+)
MNCFTRRFGRITPIAASVSVPLVFNVQQPREAQYSKPACCDETSGFKPSLKHLIPKIDIVYKNWGKGGFHEKYILEDTIGKGSFGTVYKATSREEGRSRAVKILKKNNASDIILEGMREEIHALLNVDHPHIIKLIRYYEDNSSFYLIFELCSGPDLFDAIIEGIQSEDGRMSEYDAAVALRHMLKALKYCHGKFMGHYDVKPENFMYKTPERENLIMIDMGNSSGFASESNVIKGTYEYMAPEVYQGFYGPESDVWSCGIVLFAMVTGAPFFPSKTHIMKKENADGQLAKNKHYMHERLKWAKEQGISEEAQNLLKQMLFPDRHMRITVTEALQHPFIVASYSQALHDRNKQREALTVIKGLQKNLSQMSNQPMLTRATRKLTAHLVAHNRDAMTPERLAFRMLDNFGVGRKLPVPPEMTRREGNGMLSADALKKALKSYNIIISEDIDDLFEVTDTDEDGYITFTDFLSATLPASVLNERKNFLAAFSFFDHDRDGFIDADDLIDALGCKTKAEQQKCHDAMREVCPAPYRLSFEQFLDVLDKGSAESSPSRSSTRRGIYDYSFIVVACALSMLTVLMVQHHRSS